MSIITNATNIDIRLAYKIKGFQLKGYKFDNNAYIKYVIIYKDLLLLRQSLRIKRC